MDRLKSWLPLGLTFALLALFPVACSDSGIQEPNLDEVVPSLSRDDDEKERGGDQERSQRDDGEGEEDDERAEDRNRDDGGKGDKVPRNPFDDVDLGVPGSFVNGAPVQPELVNATIGPEGGSVRLGDFEIVVPPGAVNQNTLFQIRRPVDRESRDKVIAELRPHRKWFNVPVTVRFPLDGTDAAGDPDAGVIIWDDRREEWLRFPTTVIEGGARLEAQVPHLSIWGISIELLRFYGVISSGGD